MTHQTFDFDFTFDSATKSFVAANETYTIPIGALCAFRIRVLVNGQPAQVVSSTWAVPGTQIVGGSVTQTNALGAAQTQVNPTIQGGYGGDPATIATAWVDVGTMNITITGTFIWEEVHNPFQANGQAIIVAPEFDTGNVQVNISQPTEDEGVLVVQWGSGPVPYSCAPDLVGGTIGCLQLINGLRYRGQDRTPAAVNGTAGYAHNFIDTSDPNLFYCSAIAANEGEIDDIQDRPGLPMEGEPTYTWYRVGTLPNATENYTTYLAYKAPVGGAVIASYIVVKDVTTWAWAAEGYYDPDEGGWGIDPTYSQEDDSEGWQVRAWSMPSWQNDSQQAMVWR
ncbi:hypothetical protein [Afifella pfennigii]|uniref:hypothetical protein n=1 Tax=Afifella pfennigii TaxID=209897 RepID=UPI00047D501F|nr:hypothetical protein [Afifella pfennigii]